MNYVIAIICILAVYVFGVRWWYWRDYKGRNQKPDNPIQSTPRAPHCFSRASLHAVPAHSIRVRSTESRRNDDDHLNRHHSGSDWSSSGSSYDSGSSSCDPGSSCCSSD